MRAPTATLFVLALTGVPASAAAQDRANDARARTETARTASRRAEVRLASLTHAGTYRRLEHTLSERLTIVDAQRVDVDGDGDLDVLAMVDLADGFEPKPEDARGVAVIFRERGGWRAQAIASLPRAPFETAFNWGAVESLRPGAPPLVHLMYSQAVVGERALASDTVLTFSRGALREVYSRAIDTASGRGGATTLRQLTVEATDVDGDGTNELVERVAESSHCPGGECMTDDGLFAPTVTRRAYRWDASAARFVEDAGLLVR